MFGRPIHAGAALLCAAFLLASGCARRSTARIPRPVKIGTTQTGIASWYGYPYHGRRAASGEIYDMNRLTAAHRTFPFDTWVEVTDLDNGEKVTVRINDRGPFKRHRIIDLSLAAARTIDMVGAGTARVRLKVVRAPDPVPVPPVPEIPVSKTPVPELPTSEPSTSEPPIPTPVTYSVQAGAFSTRERAEAFCDSLRTEFPNASVSQTGELWRVLLGTGLALDQADRLAGTARTSGREALVAKDR